MPIAITVKAANDTANPILALWDRVGRFEARPSMRALGYPPHVTLAVYDDLPRERLRSAIETVFADRSALRVAFTEIRRFESTPLVLWAAPRDAGALARVHALVHDAIDPALCRAHYRPGTWVPHCTLATEIAESRRDEALALARDAIVPFEVLFDSADGLIFLPVEVVVQRALVLDTPPH